MFRNLWLLLTAAAFLSAVSASHLTTYEAQQDNGDVPGTQQDDYDVQLQQEDDTSDAGLESLIADLQREDDDEVFEKKLEALIQQGSEEDGLAFAEDGDDGLVFATQDGDDGMVFTAQDGGKEGGEDSTAVAQWNNRWDGPLRVICPAGYGLYRVYSVHNNHREDRLFRWYCKRVRS